MIGEFPWVGDDSFLVYGMSRKYIYCLPHGNRLDCSHKGNTRQQKVAPHFVSIFLSSAPRVARRPFTLHRLRLRLHKILLLLLLPQSFDPTNLWSFRQTKTHLPVLTMANDEDCGGLLGSAGVGLYPILTLWTFFGMAFVAVITIHCMHTLVMAAQKLVKER